MVHIYSYIAAVHVTQLYTDRKEREYPAGRRGKHLNVLQNIDYPSYLGTEVMPEYENTWVTKKKVITNHIVPNANKILEYFAY
jgi:hypothetical protein